MDAARSQCRARRVGSAFVLFSHDDLATRASQRLGDGTTNAPAAACHQSHFPHQRVLRILPQSGRHQIHSLLRGAYWVRKPAHPLNGRCWAERRHYFEILI